MERRAQPALSLMKQALVRLACSPVHLAALIDCGSRAVCCWCQRGWEWVPSSITLIHYWGRLKVLLTIRTWACWEKAQWLTIGLPIFFLVIWAIGYVSMGLFIRSIECKSNFTSSSTHADLVTTVIQPPHYAKSFGCSYFGTKPILVACWAGMMVYDAGSMTRLSYENCHLKPTGILRPLLAYGYSRFPHTYVPLLHSACLFDQLRSSSQGYGKGTTFESCLPWWFE